MKKILIYGGSFDPPHYGHLHTAESIQSEFNFDDVLFIPCKQSVLKSKSKASAQQRVEMLELALKPYSEFRIDLLEIKRESPSYMLLTLQELKSMTLEENSLTLVIGTDALAQLNKWYEWKKILDYCNIIVINRGLRMITNFDSELSNFIANHSTSDRSLFELKKNGLIFFFDAGHYDISSTMIRNAIKERKCLHNQVPKAVEKYINTYKIYQ